VAITIRNRRLNEIMVRAKNDRRNLLYDLLPLTGGPRRRRLLSRLITPFYPKTPGFFPSARAQEIYQQIAERGYSDPLGLVDAETLAGLRAYFWKRPCHDRYRPHLGRFLPDAVPSSETNLGYYEADELVTAPGALGLVNHPLLLEVAELYLGCRPTLDNFQCWWSFPNRNEAKGTQWYHRDWDNIRSLRFFVYLTDVDEASGPHQFVIGSHESEELVEINRIPEEQVEAAFGVKQVVTLTGAAGTCFIADTFGVHRGLLPKDKPRLLMTTQYGVWRTPHAPSAPIFDRTDLRLDPYVNRVYLRPGQNGIRKI
jgi:hypothetical protein